VSTMQALKKFDVAQEILTVIMTSNDENVKRHTVVCHAFCFGNHLPFLLGLTTHSLDRISQ